MCAYTDNPFAQYSEADAYSLFTGANLRPIQRWIDIKKQYSLWLLERLEFKSC
jgi:L-histidine Nalpha-methyltransferase / hercynylcysteine S-oxide synthase